MTTLTAFNTNLIRFFEELLDTFPEERDIKMALEALRGVKVINPKLILDLFYEHVYREANEMISHEDENSIIIYARTKIGQQFNEMSAALVIFDKHWVTMSENNRTAIWKYLKVLCVLCAKAKGLPAAKTA